MKDTLKVVGMTLIGFFVALIVYPFLHEAGHSIAAVMLGGECVEFRLFPLPYMVCNAAGMESGSLIIVGLSGLLLPFLISLVIRSRFFYLWYASVLLRGISILSFVISAVVVLLHWGGVAVPNDDITQVLDLWQGGASWIFAGALLFTAILITVTVRERPLKRIVSAFA